MQILQQLGWLFFKAVPTIILFLLFYWFLRANFFKPLERTLAERSARITKAREEAEAVEAAAKQKAHSYEDALKNARTALFAEQEASRKAALDERTKLLDRVRKLEQEAVGKEKERIAREFNTARTQLENENANLAGLIAAMILERPGAPRKGAR